MMAEHLTTDEESPRQRPTNDRSLRYLLQYVGAVVLAAAGAFVCGYALDGARFFDSEGFGWKGFFGLLIGLPVGGLIGLYVGGFGLLRHRGLNLLGAMLASSLLLLGELFAIGFDCVLADVCGSLGLHKVVPQAVAVVAHFGYGVLALAVIMLLPMAIFDAAATIRKTTIPPLQG
jgi:hypothetical protein